MSKLLLLYTNALKRRPKTTNAIMTGSLFGLGDISAQLLFPTEGKLTNKYDYARTSRAIIYGSLIFSFIGDRWYKILNNKVNLPFQVKNYSTQLTMLYRVVIDQLLFAPLGVPFYFGCMTALEGQPKEVAKLKIKEQWWPTLKTNWMIWPLFQSINFSLVPVQHRLLVVNVMAIFWNTYLSYTNSKIVVGKEKYPVFYPPVIE
ncbi:ethanol metabolism protein NDAI_0C06230 [Naumovozyma dairenensis CBS 421]|uniref:Protein SYM1 n=1 Tax=Naumovozyma dairenensis (strain ATCC 10597 / BCRC 20456 / CBS 421 / NBRC 0211 / NRRL Y-12639) TaxID=1071378 RepID=G0W921_NAUDC|nr:hypothetical protein NDAI_0C06230 [Naumovozyma dairenensis CBS 421]CCD24282.1 hypothetical protein NDAI_0C06230 [Naumovozyma dairenensis CBS 421]